MQVQKKVFGRDVSSKEKKNNKCLIYFTKGKMRLIQTLKLIKIFDLSQKSFAKRKYDSLETY